MRSATHKPLTAELSDCSLAKGRGVFKLEELRHVAWASDDAQVVKFSKAPDVPEFERRLVSGERGRRSLVLRGGRRLRMCRLKRSRKSSSQTHSRYGKAPWSASALTDRRWLTYLQAGCLMHGEDTLTATWALAH